MTSLTQYTHRINVLLFSRSYRSKGNRSDVEANPLKSTAPQSSPTCLCLILIQRRIKLEIAAQDKANRSIIDSDPAEFLIADSAVHSSLESILFITKNPIAQVQHGISTDRVLIKAFDSSDNYSLPTVVRKMTITDGFSQLSNHYLLLSVMADCTYRTGVGNACVSSVDTLLAHWLLNERLLLLIDASA